MILPMPGSPPRIITPNRATAGGDSEAVTVGSVRGFGAPPIDLHWRYTGCTWPPCGLKSLMSSLTPTPIPIGRSDEVTQPSLPAGAVFGSDGKRVLERSPAQWEAEALATAEEAESREGGAAGALRYAAARMLEDGVGDAMAAADHLQMAVTTQPTQTFRPVLGALRVHAVEAGSTWAAIELLDAEATVAASVAER